MQPKNTHLENMEDLPKEKVVRKDGLATVDNLAEMFGKKKPTDDAPSESSSKSEEEKLSDFIEVVIRIPR